MTMTMWSCWFLLFCALLHQSDGASCTFQFKSGAKSLIAHDFLKPQGSSGDPTGERLFNTLALHFPLHLSDLLTCLEDGDEIHFEATIKAKIGEKKKTHSFTINHNSSSTVQHVEALIGAHEFYFSPCSVLKLKLKATIGKQKTKSSLRNFKLGPDNIRESYVWTSNLSDHDVTLQWKGTGQECGDGYVVRIDQNEPVDSRNKQLYIDGLQPCKKYWVSLAPVYKKLRGSYTPASFSTFPNERTVSVSQLEDAFEWTSRGLESCDVIESLSYWIQISDITDKTDTTLVLEEDIMPYQLKVRQERLSLQTIEQLMIAKHFRATCHSYKMNLTMVIRDLDDAQFQVVLVPNVFLTTDDHGNLQFGQGHHDQCSRKPKQEEDWSDNIKDILKLDDSNSYNDDPNDFSDDSNDYIGPTGSIGKPSDFNDDSNGKPSDFNDDSNGNPSDFNDDSNDLIDSTNDPIYTTDDPYDKDDKYSSKNETGQDIIVLAEAEEVQQEEGNATSLIAVIICVAVVAILVVVALLVYWKTRKPSNKTDNGYVSSTNWEKKIYDRKGNGVVDLESFQFSEKEEAESNDEENSIKNILEA